MKKALKIYGWAWVAVSAATLLAIIVATIYTSHHDLAEDPNSIEKIVKVDLPNIECSESENNLDRGASRWDTYIHHVRFTEELSQETIKELDELCQSDSLHWRKNADSGIYNYSDEGGIDELYYVNCAIGKDWFITVYEVDEYEGLFVIMLFALAYSILILWGLVLIIIEAFRRIRKKMRIFAY